jgi:alkylation response protein AidB-like acyl-CoA dehydrogenase
MTDDIGFDFAPDEGQRAVTALAQRVFADLASSARVVEVERTDARFDERLWRSLADTGLLGLGIEARWGGSAELPTDAAVELALLLQQQGASVAPVPLWPTLLLGAQPLQLYAEDAVQERWLPGVASGSVVLTGAYRDTDVERRVTPARARVEDARVLLSGRLTSVPVAHIAARVLVPYRLDHEWRLALIDPSADGVHLELAPTTDRGVHAHLDLADVTACVPCRSEWWRPHSR